MSRILVALCQQKQQSNDGHEHGVTIVTLVGGASIRGILLTGDGVLDLVQKARHGDGSVNVRGYSCRVREI